MPQGRVPARVAKKLAGRCSIAPMRPGDVLNGPKGQRLYTEPNVIMPGWMAFAFKVGPYPIAVAVFRPGNPTTLLYCDKEGDSKMEEMRGISRKEHMEQATRRVCELIAENFGVAPEGLAGAIPANAMPV